MYERIYSLVRQIPRGRVASYGQIARVVGGCTPRLVGYAMAAVTDPGVPWHRVINSQGRISEREGASRQRLLLQDEGVTFDASARVEFAEFGWLP